MTNGMQIFIELGMYGIFKLKKEYYYPFNFDDNVHKIDKIKQMTIFFNFDDNVNKIE